jgi:hypothetical protein
VAMAVHAVYDITAGMSYARLGRKLGFDSALAAPREASAPAST